MLFEVIARTASERGSFEELIAEYNAGSLNIDEYLRRLIALSRQLTDEEVRTVTEDLSEEELAIFDLLTRPDPPLTDQEREEVKRVAKRLLAHVHDKLVLDWRRKAETMADVRVAIRDVLDELPNDPYPRPVYDSKVQIVFEHVCTAYGDDGPNVYEESPTPTMEISTAKPVTSADEITESVLAKLRSDAEFLGVAIWFATNRFVTNSGDEARYVALTPEEWPRDPAEWPAVYVIQPPTADLRSSIWPIQHLRELRLNGLRPERQRALFFMGATGIHKIASQRHSRASSGSAPAFTQHPSTSATCSPRRTKTPSIDSCSTAARGTATGALSTFTSGGFRSIPGDPARASSPDPRRCSPRTL
jgi:hypothetical protein